jgi:hypothetical protein
MGMKKTETMKHKVLENLIRRKLKRMGYELTKSKRRDPQAYDFAGYMILDKWTRATVRGNEQGRNFELTLDDVEAFTREGV